MSTTIAILNVPPHRLYRIIQSSLFGPVLCLLLVSGGCVALLNYSSWSGSLSLTKPLKNPTIKICESSSLQFDVTHDKEKNLIFI